MVTGMFSDGDLTLRPMTLDDVRATYDWTIDAPTNLVNGGPPLIPLTWEHYRDRWAARPSGPDRADFTIAADERQVGFCMLALFDHLARSAMLGITLAPDARGRHIGRRAMRLLVDYGFDDRGLNRIWLGTLAINEPGLRAYRAVGFVEETREREAAWVDGTYVDGVRMGLLRSEWERANADR
jgi:RimJ/RimL family protein N-acetyltransferase